MTHHFNLLNSANVANCLSALSATDLASSSCCCRSLSLTAFSGQLSVKETASWFALTHLNRWNPAPLARRAGESWFVIYVMADALLEAVKAVSVGSSHDEMEQKVVWFLILGGSFDQNRQLNQGDAIGNWLLTLVQCFNATSRKLSRAQAGSLLPRAAAIASFLGAGGHWGNAAELLLAQLRSLSFPGRSTTAGAAEAVSSDPSTLFRATESADPVAIEMLITTSTFLVDRLYASTYVRDSAEDAEDLLLAVNLSREAVAKSSLVSPAPSFWLLNQRVRAVRLRGKQNLNGCEGVAVDFDPESARYEVTFEGGEDDGQGRPLKFKLKPTNLELACGGGEIPIPGDTAASNSAAMPPPAVVPGAVPESPAAASATFAVESMKKTAPMVAPLGFASGVARHGAALVALGRALALLGQHVGLGAHLSLAEDIRGSLPGAEELFDEGALALLKAIALAAAHEDTLGRALAVAALGELYYCGASANSRNRTAILSRGAPLAGSRAIVMQSLTDDSITLSRTAIALLEALNAGEGFHCARVTKDLGKVLQFRGAVLNGGNADCEAGRALLEAALEMQKRLAGSKHPLTRNVMRLMNRERAAATEEDGDEEASTEEESAIAGLGDLRTERQRLLRPAC